MSNRNQMRTGMGYAEREAGSRMNSSITIEVMKPAALGAVERGLWSQFRAASNRYASPYFDLRYVLAAEEASPGGEVAVLHRAGRIVGFLPFQRRGGLIQPLGAPMTDYHGPLAAPGETITLRQVIEALDGRSYRFTGLVADDAAGARHLASHRILQADLSSGFDAWLADRELRHPRFFKGKRRNRRALEREVGPLQFKWSRDEDGLLDYVIGLKRAQYRRTGLHDIFGCGWTERMLRVLVEAREPDFGLGFATLRAGGSLISAEVALLSGGVYHLWLPVYEPAYARYGPGMLMTLDTLQAIAAEGVQKVDFGRDDADYKRYLADPAGTVLEGVLHAEPGPVAQWADRTVASLSPLGVASLRNRLRRRLDVISACETSAWGWTSGVALAGMLMVAQGAAPLIRTPAGPQRRPDVQRFQSRHVGRIDTPVTQAQPLSNAQA